MRRRDKNQKLQERRAMIGAGLAAAVLIGLGALALTGEPAPDPATGCLEDTLTSRVSVILDTTTALTNAQRRNLRVKFDRLLKEEVPEKTLLQLYTIDHALLRGLSAPVFNKCRLKNGLQANALTQNAQIDQMRYEAQFARPLREAFDAAMTSPEGQRSPLFEALLDYGILNPPTPNVRHQIILITDLKQYTDQINLIRPFSLKDAEAALRQADYFSNLTGVDVHVWLLRDMTRPDDAAKEKALILLWERYLASSGASLQSLSRVR